MSDHNATIVWRDYKTGLVSACTTRVIWLYEYPELFEVGAQSGVEKECLVRNPSKDQVLQMIEETTGEEK